MRVLLATAMLGFWAATAWAADGVEITPRAGYQFGANLNTEDGELRFGSGGLFGLLVDVPVQPNGFLEIRYDHYRSTVKLHDDTLGGETSVFDVAVNSLQLGGLLDLQPGAVRPFVAATLGLQVYDPEPSGYDAVTRFVGALGGGGKFYLSRRVGLRAQATIEGVFFGGNGLVFCNSGSCFVTLSGRFVASGEVSGGLIVVF